MIKNETLNNAEIYEIELISHAGRSEYIHEIFNGFDIYEDIQSHFLYGYLSLTDTSDIMKNFPIVGGEEVRILFGDNKTRSARFVDFVIKGVEPQPNTVEENNRQYYYTFKLVSKASLDGSLIKFSRRYNNTVFSILQDFLSLVGSYRVLNVLSDFEQMDFVANNWSIHQILDYICYKNSDTLIFETIDKMVAAKLRDLVIQEPVEELIHSHTLDTATLHNSVLLRTFASYFDIEKLAQMGALGTTAYQVSPDKYSHKKEQKALNDIYDNEYPMMGASQIFHDSISHPLNNVIATFENPDTRIERNLILNTLKNYQLVVKTNGVATRNVGQVITYNMPSSDRSGQNANFEGDWLITQIRHMIGADKRYVQNIKLFKNAFFNRRS